MYVFTTAVAAAAAAAAAASGVHGLTAEQQRAMQMGWCHNLLPSYIFCHFYSMTHRRRNDDDERPAARPSKITGILIELPILIYYIYNANPYILHT